MSSDQRHILEKLFHAGLDAVRGKISVQDFCRVNRLKKPDRILAIGKAACSMYLGLPEDFKINSHALIITKYGHIDGDLVEHHNIKIIESAHPMPAAISLEAGRGAIKFIEGMDDQSTLLMLVSGGASAMVENLKDGLSLEELIALNAECLAGGDDIKAINKKRAEISTIKNGGLLSHFKGMSVEVLAISDVQGDAMSVIGSGIGAKGTVDNGYQSHVVASNKVARDAIVKQAKLMGINTIKNEECLYGDIEDVSQNIYQTVQDGPSGLYIFGGEPTIKLPDNPGKGGRNQALALLLARLAQGKSNLFFLVAGTDGTDGPTNAAGGYVDGNTYRYPDVDEAIVRADSANFLNQSGHQFITGPTGANVMDIALMLKI